MLPISGTVSLVDNRGAGAVSSLSYTSAASISQLAKTGSMAVNPYLAFDPLPSPTVLMPAIDRWVDYQTSWASPSTQSIYLGILAYANGVMSPGILLGSNKATQNSLLSSAQTAQANLRQIQVSFSISGFGANEVLTSVTFDGVPVTAA